MRCFSNFFFICCLFLSACAGEQIDRQAINFNHAIADSNNKQILLNVLRSAMRKPLYFHGNGNLTTSDSLGLSISGNVPLNAVSAITGNTAGAFNLNSGFTNHTISNLNSADFRRGMLAPITFNTLQFYLRGDWNQELLMNLLIQNVQMPKWTFLKLRDRTDLKNCLRRHRKLCSFAMILKEIIDKPKGCKMTEKSQIDNPIVQEGNKVRFVNTGRDECKLLDFQYLTLLFLINDLDIAEIVETVNLKTIPTDEQRFSREVRKPTNKLGIVGTIRAPEGILFYLGELTAGKLFESHKYSPRISSSTTALTTREFFVVKKGPGLKVGDITAREDTTIIHIPKPPLINSSDASHRTFQVLTLVKQLIELQVSNNALIGPTNVNVID